MESVFQPGIDRVKTSLEGVFPFDQPEETPLDERFCFHRIGLEGLSRLI